jgi:type IV secretory pathway VirB10-like protein
LVLFRNISELERQANIAKNKALLEELELGDAVNSIGFSKKPPPPPPKAKAKAKPVQPAKRPKREAVEDPGPRRQSARLKRSADDPNESPKKKRARLVRALLNSVVVVPCLTFGTYSCSKQRKSRDERLKTNVSKPRSVRGRQRNLVTKILSSRLFSTLRTPKTKLNRRTSGG